MKKSLQSLAHLIPIAALLALWFFYDFQFTIHPVPLILLSVCIIVCPLVGVLRLSAFSRNIFYILSVFTYCGGIFACRELGGDISAFIMLGIGTVSFGILLINRLLPADTPEERLLTLRGMKGGRARRSILLTQSYSSFFRIGGILFSTLYVCYLLIAKSASPDELWSTATFILGFSLLFHLLHCLLDTDFMTIRSGKKKIARAKYVIVSVLTFCLILIIGYVYVGSNHMASDPSFSTAVRAVQTILSPVFIATGIGFVIGLILGYILSVIACRFFLTIFQGTQIIPTAIFSGLLFHLLPPSFFEQINTVSIAIPLICMTVCSLLESRATLLVYKNLPVQNRKQNLLTPFVYLPTVSLIPVLLLTGSFSSVFIDVTSNGILCNLTDFPLTLTASVLAVIMLILLILTLLTKEARQHD